MLEYNQLNAHQKKFISNGCGAKKSWINPPDLIFEEDCNEHDFDYWLGKSKEDKAKYDKNYYGRMKKRIKTKVSGYFKKLHYHIWAWAYYRFVVRFGDEHFNYADEYKNMTDLVFEMQRGGL